MLPDSAFQSNESVVVGVTDEGVIKSGPILRSNNHGQVYARCNLPSVDPAGR